MPLRNPTDYDDLPTTTAAATDALGPEAGGETCADRGEWLDRIETLIERYPWPALLLALCIGYALSRKMR